MISQQKKSKKKKEMEREKGSNDGRCEEDDAGLVGRWVGLKKMRGRVWMRGRVVVWGVKKMRGRLI